MSALCLAGLNCTLLLESECSPLLQTASDESCCLCAVLCSGCFPLFCVLCLLHCSVVCGKSAAGFPVLEWKCLCGVKSYWDFDSEVVLTCLPQIQPCSVFERGFASVVTVRCVCPLVMRTFSNVWCLKGWVLNTDRCHSWTLLLFVV